MKVRVNFFLPKDIYDRIQVIAETEGTTSAELFRNAVKKFIYDYRNEDINKFLNKKPDTSPELDEKW